VRVIPARQSALFTASTSSRQIAMRAAGVGHAEWTRHCTYSDAARFFSYRRDGKCGRQATLVWIRD